MTTPNLAFEISNGGETGIGELVLPATIGPSLQRRYQGRR